MKKNGGTMIDQETKQLIIDVIDGAEGLSGSLFLSHEVICESIKRLRKLHIEQDLYMERFCKNMGLTIPPRSTKAEEHYQTHQVPILNRKVAKVDKVEIR